MTAKDSVDAGRLKLMLSELRLPTIKDTWPDFAARSDKEGWPAARFLAALVENELADRARRRIARCVCESVLSAKWESLPCDATSHVAEGNCVAVGQV